jgi:hypothetical protein
VGVVELMRKPIAIRGTGGRTIPRWGLALTVTALVLGMPLMAAHRNSFSISVGGTLVVTSVATFTSLLSRDR